MKPVICIRCEFFDTACLFFLNMATILYSIPGTIVTVSPENINLGNVHLINILSNHLSYLDKAKLS